MLLKLLRRSRRPVAVVGVARALVTVPPTPALEVGMALAGPRVMP